jgi:LysM repeat protein
MLVRAVRGAITVAVLVTISALPHAALGQQPTPMPKTHTVKRGDTLWDIAKLYLGDPFLWPEIYRLNNDVIEDPHWIFPGEVLKLPAPQAQVVAVTPPVPAPTPVRPVTPPVTRLDTVPPPPHRAVRIGEYVAAPWVDERGGPHGSGYIIENGNLPGIAWPDRSRMNLYDPVMIAPPVGAVAPEHELYLSYRLGPLIEDLGQIVIPTGIIEVTRSPRHGEATVGRVVKMFGEVLQGQRLIAYDTTGALAIGRPTPVTNGHSGTVRWISSEPVLPRMQNYVVLDISRRDSLRTGDQIELYQPRQAAYDENGLAIPEISIAHAQVMRVTPFGASAIITSQEQPKIEEGTAARVAAKMH